MISSSNTGILSDKTAFSSGTASIVSRRRIYSDLDLSLYHSEQTKNDIVPLEDIDAVKNSIKILLLSNHFDRPFQPYLGANLTSLLFEPADQFTTFCIRENIKLILEKHEQRVNDVGVIVQFDPADNRYQVTLTFQVITQAKTVNMNIFLSRVR